MFIATIIAIFVSFLCAVDGIIVRILTDELHPFLIVFYRSLFGLIIIIPFFLKDKKVFISHYKYLHFLRALLKDKSNYCLIEPKELESIKSYFKTSENKLAVNA